MPARSQSQNEGVTSANRVNDPKRISSRRHLPVPVGSPRRSCTQQPHKTVRHFARTDSRRNENSNRPRKSKSHHARSVPAAFSAKKAAYVRSTPSLSSTFAVQPSWESRETFISLRGVPSGFE